MTNAEPPVDVAQRMREDIKAETERPLESEEDLWAFKRARQAADLEAMQSGRRTQDEMSWFSGGRAKRCKIPGTPY